MSRRAGLICALGLALLAAAGPTRAQPAAVQVWTSTADGSLRLARQTDLMPGPAGADAAEATIALDPSQRFQAMTGFGAALTDAAAAVIHRLPLARRRALMAELFGRNGLRIGFLRLTIGASDFSSRHYTYDDLAPGQADPTLARFSIRPARRQVLPLVREARRLNPDLVLMASPWSAPAWMKTSDGLVTGSLRPEAYDAWARYLARYVAEMGRAGAPISLITLQNEPGFEPADYPGMRVEPQARARFIGGFLGPELKRRGLSTGILDHDHNWDRPDSPLTVLADPVARSYVRGVAWHCYNGEVSAQETVHAAAPDKDAYFTECSGGDWTKDRASAFDFLMGELMIGATRHWAKGVLFWNLALDERHGPHLGGCGDCRGVVTIDSRTGAVTRNVEYDVLGHLSRFVRPGAVRIAAETTQRDLQVVAFRNADDASLVVLARNAGVSPLTARFTLAGRAVRTTLPPGAASTLVWPAR